MIPEEPVSGSPIATTEIRRRSPSPDWDFDDEDKTVRTSSNRNFNSFWLLGNLFEDVVLQKV